MTRVLCLDVGKSGSGSLYPICWASPPRGGTIFTQGADRDVDRVLDLARTYDTRKVLCGLPRNMDGSEGFQARAVRSFASWRARASLSAFRTSASPASAAGCSGGRRQGDRRKRYWTSWRPPHPAILSGCGGWQEKQEGQADGQQRTFRRQPIVELIDEDGQTVRFEHVYTVPTRETNMCLPSR